MSSVEKTDDRVFVAQHAELNCDNQSLHSNVVSGLAMSDGTSQNITLHDVYQLVHRQVQRS